MDTFLKGLSAKVHIFHCFSLPCVPPWAACLRCLKGSVGSLLLAWYQCGEELPVSCMVCGPATVPSGSGLRRSLERSVD